MKIVYLIPAPDMDERSIDALKFENCSVITLKLEPLTLNTEINEYVDGLRKQIKYDSPILLGCCYGGVLAIELSRVVAAEKVIVVSSVKHRRELPPSRKAIGVIYYYFPNGVLRFFGVGLAFLLNKILRIRMKIPRIWRKSGQNKFIVKHLLSFEGTVDKDVIHIHGQDDFIFPIRNIANVHTVIDSGHFMLDTKRRSTLAAIENVIHSD